MSTIPTFFALTGILKKQQRPKSGIYININLSKEQTVPNNVLNCLETLKNQVFNLHISEITMSKWVLMTFIINEICKGIRDDF